MDSKFSMPAGKRFTVVDLFCGCGGLSRGLERTGRFWTGFGVDIHKPAIDTFVLNHGLAETRPTGHLGDIREVRPEDIWTALEPYGVKAAGDLDCLVGGPPCEGFSRNTVYTRRHDIGLDTAGVTEVAPIVYKEAKYWQVAWQGTPLVGEAPQRVEKIVRAYNPFLSDPRNFLFRSFLEHAAFLRPKLILIENVQQMLTHLGGSIAAEIIESLAEMGYHSEARVLNAAEFGVPQLRRRAFFLAVRKDLLPRMGSLPWPVPTHLEGRQLPLGSGPINL
jgi:DNA (cytosine-5)-methyltransferase 1